jgi:hypothetical protein
MDGYHDEGAIGGELMKRSVVTDETGKVLATCPLIETNAGASTDQPIHLGFAPMPGQRVHIVEIPEELNSREGLMALHTSYRVVVQDGIPHMEQSLT